MTSPLVQIKKIILRSKNESTVFIRQNLDIVIGKSALISLSTKLSKLLSE